MCQGGGEMTLRIYDWRNRPKDIRLPDKEISEIFVVVLSGDETGTVTFTDGTTLGFDACNCRTVGFNDGYYSVRGKLISPWMNFKPSDGRTYSYQRRNEFMLRGGGD
jgi:hypothetical protein